MIEKVKGLPRQTVVSYLKKRKTLDEALDMLFDSMLREERLTKEVKRLMCAESALLKIRKTIRRVDLPEDEDA